MLTHIRRNYHEKSIIFSNSSIYSFSRLCQIVDCAKQSNNPVQVPTSDQNEIISLVKSGNVGPSATGQGSLIYSDGDRRIFTFHALTHPNGSVEGQGVYRRVSSNPERRMQFDFYIDCLNVQGNMAIMSGMITRVVRLTPNPNDPIEVGQYIQFKVIDNGEGAKADPDQMSYFAHGPLDAVPPCDQYDLNWGLFTLDAGNIQVRP